MNRNIYIVLFNPSKALHNVGDVTPNAGCD